MELTKIFLTVAMMITLATKTIGGGVETNPALISSTAPPKAGPLMPKRVSRFLQQEVRNPRAADHCHKDEEVCYVQDGSTSICCNNKCVYLATDAHNCGACKRKCKFTQVCCRESASRLL
ncbi:Stigma-specific STIG1-like protein 2 [Hibiscus syriacus]|uniref:Stigma-specific STIG1-like protein 2 n=1 Tax=Hibiscus syriacus TaxID=106335 RepID=A0A6A3AKF0_HIBSY|nr:stigma-specific STIG1-like protein 3 [Hibiscus syriacus]KAE8704343.1 Stigma-specific STIG1-like protein 2 [Hibiscus syriacus]